MQRQRPSWSSHAVLPHLPALQLGSSMSVQVSHERAGRLIDQASSMSPADRSRIVHALELANVDTSKAQNAGHAHMLAASLAESVVHHILFAKGQVSEPVSVSRRRKQVEEAEMLSSRKRVKTSTRRRKEDRLLQKLDVMRKLIKDALDSLTLIESIPSTSSSSALLTNSDSRLVLVLGSSASMPRETFVVDLIDVVQRPADIGSHYDALMRRSDVNEATASPSIPAEITTRQREKAREKMSSQWERKLVRMMVSAEELEPFFSSPLAPTRLHVFLSASSQFRCPGWSARRHLNLDLSDLQAVDSGVCSSANDTTSSEADMDQRGPMCSSPHIPRTFSQAQDGSESVSSLTSSWMDSGSDSMFETSNSSYSDPGTHPLQHHMPQVEEQDLGFKGNKEGLAHLDMVEPENATSSSGSATFRNDEDPASTPLKRSLDELQVSQPDNVKRSREVANAPLAARKAKTPAADSLLGRNLLRPRDGSDSGSTRSTRKRVPRCAGIRIELGDPARKASNIPAAPYERCWFQCDSVLEGYR